MHAQAFLLLMSEGNYVAVLCSFLSRSRFSRPSRVDVVLEAVTAEERPFNNLVILLFALSTWPSQCLSLATFGF